MTQDDLSSRQPGQPRVIVDRLSESLVRWRGRTAEIAPVDLIGEISGALPFHLIADLRKVKGSLQEAITTQDALFDWLDPVAAELVSPVLLGNDEASALPVLVSEYWCSDAVIVLFSRQQRSALLSHLRHCLRGNTETDAEGTLQGIVAYCWPSALAALLESETAGFSPQFFRGIDAVLVEVPGQPEWWQIYGGTTAAAVLDDVV